jgi:hypothetical protein
MVTAISPGDFARRHLSRRQHRRLAAHVVDHPPHGRPDRIGGAGPCVDLCTELVGLRGQRSDRVARCERRDRQDWRLPRTAVGRRLDGELAIAAEPAA